MSKPQIKEPNPRARLTLNELAKVQSIAAKHITFSLTLACPLKCAHCIVGAGPDKGYTTMPVEVARNYAAQMPALYAHGIRYISFTGGEPLLARAQLRILSTAAAEAGMECGVVTAAHWATGESITRRVVESFPGIHLWDLSVDAYHSNFVSLEKIRIAHQAIKSLGRCASLRFTYHDPLTDEDREILKFLGTFAEESEIFSQKIRKAGRGKDLGIPDSHKFHPWRKPCITQGMVVRYDGSLGPCCISLVEERRHPFQLGDARNRPLTEIHTHYMSLPLLQLIRLIGFMEVMQWLEEADLNKELPGSLPDDVCDLCPMLFTNPRITEYLTNRVAKPENRLRIAVLASRLLGEHQMLQRTVRELREGASEIEGFELAAALAVQPDWDGITLASGATQ
ncbi:MAG: radical SAM protein [Acidobacteria bacterium]|nr:radical SAM protein [Acidobacteriota bacterium]